MFLCANKLHLTITRSTRCQAKFRYLQALIPALKLDERVEIQINHSIHKCCIFVRILDIHISIHYD